MANKNNSVWKDLLTIFLNQKKYIVALAILILLVAGIDVLFPLLNKIAIDYFATSMGSQNEFIIFIVIYFILIILFGVLVYFYLKTCGIIEHNFAYDLRELAYNKVLNLSFSYFDKNSDGWIISRLTSDIYRITEILSWGLMDFGYGLISMIGITVVMFLNNFKLALMILAIVPILVYLSYFFQSRILKQQRKVRAANSEVTQAFSESINGAQTIKSLALENIVKADFEVLALKMQKSSVKANWYSALFIPSIIFLSGISSAIIIYYGGVQVVSGIMQFGVLMMFVSYIHLFFQPLREIARLIAELQLAKASAERLMQLLNSEIEVVDNPKVIEKYGSILAPKTEVYEPVVGDVSFKHVDFYYQASEPVLSDFNLEVKAKSQIALVGKTGSGKSTIVNLLARFYEPVSGEILIDGVNISKRSLGWLRSNVGFVLQTPHLFSGSIKDNIMYGKLDATFEEIVAAAKLANAHDFIIKLDKGYDSDVGEGGSKLSVGQKQLLAFARTIIKNPSILVLDEATASIDSESEIKIQSATKNLLADKTSFIVAHRLSTIVEADMILVIKKGQIVEAGNHETLLKQAGYYYDLYTNQFKDLNN